MRCLGLGVSPQTSMARLMMSKTGLARGGGGGGGDRRWVCEAEECAKRVSLVREGEDGTSEKKERVAWLLSTYRAP